jgi:Ca2+/Na+ antiporter
MKKINRLITFLLLMICPAMTFAQGFDSTMRSNGRIYVVIAVIVTILLGLILYLVKLERKIKKLEDNAQ